MSRPFALSVFVACSAHALLLFGFKSPATNPDPAPRVAARPEPWKPVMLEPEEIEKVDTIEIVDKPAGGKLAPPAPMTPDSAAEKISPEDILIAITRSDPARVPLETRIIPTGPGDANGDPNALDIGPGTPDGVGIFDSSRLDNEPRTRVQTAPAYPFALKANGVSGEVLVEFVVDERGRVIHPRIIRSSHAEFEAPTLAAVARWRFEPGTRNLRPVRFRMAVPVKFNLNE